MLPKEVYRIGSCNRCGKCCQGSTLKPRLWAYIIAHQKVKLNPLAKKGTCPNLSFDEHGKATCKIYNHRPKMCQDFPISPIDLAELPDCGFKFVDEKGCIVDILKVEE